MAALSGPRFIILVAAIYLVSLFMMGRVSGQLVPALIIFGDSTVDVGNNNHLRTVLKSNFAPYGRDFDTKQPTGRFSDGRISTDFTAELLGFSSFPPPYLSPEATGARIVTGVNFASGGSGFFDSTAQHFNVIAMSRQLELFSEYGQRLEQIVGSRNASSIISGALYVVSAGSSDFVQNYFMNLRLQRLYTVEEFSDIILRLAARFIENLYSQGARRIGVVSLAPFGCLPLQINLLGGGRTGCVERLNRVAEAYNQGLNQTVDQFSSTYSDLKIAYFDIYSPFVDIIEHPASNGFTEVRRSCCGTGTVETALLCNKFSPGTCRNASEFVFWDSVHPSQAANEILANSLVLSGLELIS